MNGDVTDFELWDPDGLGPQPLNLVAAGYFAAVDEQDIRNVATWDGTSWYRVGTGVTGGFPVPGTFTLAVLPDNTLVAGGNFTAAGGVSAARIARWNGSAWSAFGSGFNNNVLATAVLPSGSLVAAGSFTASGTTLMNRIATWNGSAWSALGGGVNGPVYCMSVLPNGHLVVGGDFTMAGTIPANRIARWTGSAWVAYGSGMNGDVRVVKPAPDGSLVAGGAFTAAGGVPTGCVARWNAGSWSAIGSGLSGTLNDVAFTPAGGIIAAGGANRSNGLLVGCAAHWNGVTWSPLGEIVPRSFLTCVQMLPSGRLAAGGRFSDPVGDGINRAFFNFGSPAPEIVVQPQSVSKCRSGSAMMQVGANNTPTGYRWQWQQDGNPTAWSDLVEGINQDSQGQPVVRVSGSATPTLTIETLAAFAQVNPRLFRCVATNPCGVANSDGAALSLCVADSDCDSDTDSDDVLGFFTAFDAGDNAADADGDGDTDSDDVIVFFESWESGC